MPPTAKAQKPQGLTIRAYDVGFGDCFLLTFRYAGGPRHVLVDFGSTAAARKGVSLDMTIADDIAKVAGGKLDAVVVTHRHADHISGFTTRSGKGSGDIIRKCARDAVIVQPWTEAPNLAPTATSVSVSRRNTSKSLAVSQMRALDGMQEVAAVIARRAANIEVTDVDPEPQDEERDTGQPAARPRQKVGAGPELGVGEGTREKLRFLGQTNVKNLSAVKNLMTMSSPRKRHYVYFGSKSGLDGALPGVTIEVLGPPTVEQSDEVLKERRADQAEFWMLAASATRMTAAANKALFAGERFIAGGAAPRAARWFIRRVRTIHAQQLFELVRIVDDALNNTSVILLFTIGKTRLLFPGDAQIENWQYALKLAKGSEQILKKLATVDVYKVGHHGSRNATPKTLWKAFEKRRKGLKTIMSTKAGKFPGRPGSGTEVPRDTLKKALLAETKLTNTQDLAGTKKEYSVDIDVPLG